MKAHYMIWAFVKGILLLLGMLCFIGCDKIIHKQEINDPNFEINKSIAFLPFTHLTDDRESVIFADAIMEDIRNHFSRIAEFQVLTTSPLLKYKNSSKSHAQIADELDVKYLVHGSVQKVNHQMEVHTSLVRADLDHEIWSEVYTRSVQETFQLGFDVSTEIAEQLKVRFDQRIQSNFISTPTKNLEVRAKYSRAKNMLYYGKRDTLPQLIELLQKITLWDDPNFADAHSLLAEVYRFQSNFQGGEAFAELKSKALMSAFRAIEIDPLQGAAYMVMFYYALLDYNLDQAGEFITTAVDVSPNEPLTLRVYPFYLIMTNQIEKAIQVEDKVRKIEPLGDPRDFQIIGELPFIRIQKADSLLRICETLYPDHWMTLMGKARMALGKGEFEYALSLYNELRDHGFHLNGYLDIMKGYTHACLGQYAQAFELASLVPDPVKNIALCQINTGLGNLDTAIFHLEQCLNSTDARQRQFVVNFLVNGLAEPLKDEPQYLQIMKRLGLDKYWN